MNILKIPQSTEEIWRLAFPPSSKFSNRRIWNSNISKLRSRIIPRKEQLSVRARVANRGRVSNESTYCFVRIDTFTVVKKKGCHRSLVGAKRFGVGVSSVPACTVAVSIFTENFCGFWLDRIASVPRLRVNRCRYIKNNDARIGSQSFTAPSPSHCARKSFRLGNTVERRVPPACITTFSTIVSYPKTIFE